MIIHGLQVFNSFAESVVKYLVVTALREDFGLELIGPVWLAFLVGEVRRHEGIVVTFKLMFGFLLYSITTNDRIKHA